MHARIALCGYARSGKDEAAKALLPFDYERCCFGDLIKAQLDPLVREHLGFSAFTENDAEKAIIRGVLEQWGEANYDGITEAFFANLPERAVNTRLVRVREAERWKAAGGVIFEVVRPGVGPATQWEADRLAELGAAGLIDATLWNCGDVHQLHARMRYFAGV